MTTQTQHAGPDERVELIAQMLEMADRQFSSNRPIYHTVGLLRRAAALLAEDGRAGGEVVATLHDDGHFTWKSNDLRTKHGSNFAGWRMDVYAHPQQQAAQAAVSQWQPIETAPKDGTVILVTDTFTYRSDPDKKPHHVYRAVRWYEDGGWEIYNDGEIIDEDGPTFWMPLPAEPVSMLSAAPVEQKANGIGKDQP